MATETITKDEVVARLEGDWQFVERAILFVADRQTDIERVTRATIYKNQRGLSVPLARIGTDLAERLRDGGAFSWQDILNAVEVCTYHWRQAGILMLMEQGFSLEDAVYCVYPIKTPRRAPRPARGREERLVDRDAWTLLVEVELDQKYQRELMAELRERQLAEINAEIAALTDTRHELVCLTEREILSVTTIRRHAAEILKLEEVFVEGIGVMTA